MECGMPRLEPGVETGYRPRPNSATLADCRFATPVISTRMEPRATTSLAPTDFTPSGKAKGHRVRRRAVPLAWTDPTHRKLDHGGP
jgi:hypothetical protein